MTFLSNSRDLALASIVSCIGWSAQAAPVDMTTLTTNIAVAIDSNDLRVAFEGLAATPATAFMAPISSTRKFSGSFDFDLQFQGNGLQGEGLSFLIQNDPAGAHVLGNPGDQLGAGLIQNAIGIGFQSGGNNHVTIFTSTDSGGPLGGTAPLQNFPLGISADDRVHVTFDYDGTTLSFTALNQTDNQLISDSRIFDLTPLGPSVYIGFTGGTSELTSTEDISNFDFAAAAPEQSTWAMMIIGFAGIGATTYRRRRKQNLHVA